MGNKNSAPESQHKKMQPQKPKKTFIQSEENQGLHNIENKLSLALDRLGKKQSFVPSSIIDDDEDEKESQIIKKELYEVEVQYQMKMKELDENFEKEQKMLKKQQMKKEQPEEERFVDQEKNMEKDSDDGYQQEKWSIERNLKEEPQESIKDPLESMKEEYFFRKKVIESKYQEDVKKIKAKKKRRQILIDVDPKFKADQDILTDKNKIYDNFDKIYEKNPQNTLHLCRKLLKKPTQAQLEETKKIEQDLLEIVRTKDKLKNKGIAIIMLGLKNAIEKYKGVFTFSRQSNAKTQLSAKILTSGFLENTFMFREHLKNNEKWNFDALYGNNEKIKEFIEEYKTEKAKQFDINRENIVVTRLIEGSVIVESALTESDECSTVLSRIEDSRIHPHPYFKYFQLSLEDFDPKGNRTYHDYLLRDTRGDWFYYLPVFCDRFGLNVIDKYDDGDNQWLSMKKEPNQWAVIFHGVNYPGKMIEAKNRKIINSIMDGLPSGTMLEAGFRQLYEEKNAVNKPGKQILKGIYGSPHFEVCLGFTEALEVEGKNYRLVLQCRAKPESIKVCQPKQTYWVINKSKDIRPYGIILVQEENKQKIKKIKDVYERFTFNCQQNEESKVKKYQVEDSFFKS